MKILPLISLGIVASAAIALAPEALANTWRAAHRMSGFSANSNYYVYLESSRDTGAGIPKAELQIVQIPTNSCVKNGCIETKYGESDSNKSTKMAEDDLLKKTWNNRQSLSLTPPQAGTKLNIISRTPGANGSETIAVKVNSAKPLQIRLEQQQKNASAGKESAAMRLVINYNGQQRVIGSLNNFQDWVFSYSIREVRLSPNGRNVVVLVERTERTFEGVLKTTFVQGFVL
jgi:predicted secreted protein